MPDSTELLELISANNLHEQQELQMTYPTAPAGHLPPRPALLQGKVVW